MEPDMPEKIGTRLVGRRIVVAVTGAIAAYKACELVSTLVQLGAEVRVVMTENVRYFVGPDTFSALSGHLVRCKMYGEPSQDELEHVSLAQFGEVIAVVPATANLLGKVAAGICDDLVTTTIAAAAGPVVVAPCMNWRMWENPITQRNVQTLQELGYHLVGPEVGRLACGEEGAGRLVDTDQIITAIIEALPQVAQLAPASALAGRRVLVTAGPTREHLDPVRFISNPSSGKMGFALARTASARDAEVTLVTGPTALNSPPGLATVAVESAREMFEAVMTHLPGADVFIGAAAVANFTPAQQVSQKIRSTDEGLAIKLVPTPDIIAAVANSDTRPAVVVGFAAETECLRENALRKLRDKKLDLIVANDLTVPDVGFGADTNEVIIARSDGTVQEVSKRSKSEIAEIIWDEIEQLLEAAEM